MTDTEYFAVKAASNSLLKKGLRSMRHLWYAMNHESPTTDAMFMGRLIHTAILEPEAVGATYDVGPCDSKAKKEWKEWAKEMPDDAVLIKSSQLETALAMRDAVYRKPRLKALLQLKGVVEEPIFWKDPLYGFDCKAKPDKLIQSAGLILDLKSCEDASYEAFQRSIAKYGYHIQAWFYLMGCEILKIPCPEFVILAVEKTPPYESVAYRITPEWLEIAQIQMTPIMEAYAKGIKKNTWAGYPDKIVESLPPRWMNPQTDA